MPELPPLNALKYFEVAARTGSYVKAASELHVTPAAVSQQVRLLEGYFRRKLFVRYSNRIALTDAGQAIFAGAAPALEDLSALADSFKGKLERSRLIVSVLPSLAECWFMPLLAQLAKGGTGLRIDLRVEDDPVDFSEHRIDLRITYSANLYPELNVVPLFRDDVAPFCSPQFQTQHLPNAGALVRLPDEYFIHTSWGQNFASHPSWSDWLKAAGMARTIDNGKGHRANASRLTLDFARAGLGVSLGQRKLAAEFVRRGELVALSERALPLGHNYCAYYPEAKAKKNGLLQLVAMAREDQV